MLLKQKIMKEEKIKLCLSLICVLIPWVAILALIIVNGDDINAYLVFTLVLYLPVFLMVLFLGLCRFEWYCVYNDRIEACGIWGIKNKAYYRDVLYIEEVEIPLTSRGTYKTFFIFRDDRKSNGNILERESCYNRKEYSFRIYKTRELEDCIVNTLRLEIKSR